MIEQREIQLQQENPDYLYRFVSLEQWQEIQLQNQVVNSSIDKDFIHLATKKQLNAVTQKFWNNKDHIILKLASKIVKKRLLYETNSGGTTRYYHLYEGHIPLDAVVEFSIVRGINN